MNLVTGIYILESPVKNPCPDRRRTGWGDQAEFPAGTYKVENNEGDVDKWQRSIVKIRGKSGYISNLNELERFQALTSKLVLKKELVLGDVYELYAPFPCHALVLALLLRRGFVSLGLIGATLEDLGKMSEGEVDKLMVEHGLE